jgi:hypothetical protein
MARDWGTIMKSAGSDSPPPSTGGRDWDSILQSTELSTAQPVTKPVTPEKTTPDEKKKKPGALKAAEQGFVYKGSAGADKMLLNAVKLRS